MQHTYPSSRTTVCYQQIRTLAALMCDAHDDDEHGEEWMKRAQSAASQVRAARQLIFDAVVALRTSPTQR
jgi:hypothetical protein